MSLALIFLAIQLWGSGKIFCACVELSGYILHNFCADIPGIFKHLWRETYLPALEHAKELGIPITIHCGEVCKYIRTTSEPLSPSWSLFPCRTSWSMKWKTWWQQVANRNEIRAVLDFCPQRLGHVCCLNDEEWKKLKSLMIPVSFSLIVPNQFHVTLTHA